MQCTARKVCALVLSCGLVVSVIIYVIASSENETAKQMFNYGQVWSDSEVDQFLNDNIQRKQIIQDNCAGLTDRGYLFQHFYLGSFLTEPTRKFIWCYTPKIGTMSWMEIFTKMYNVTTHIDRVHDQMWALEPTVISAEEKRIAMAKVKYQKSDWNSMMIARHPLDRLQSAYVDKIVSHQARVPKPDGSPGNIEEPTYEDFLNWLAKTAQVNQLNDHWKPNWQRCNPCLNNYDYILKMETYERDTNALIRKLGLLEGNFTVGHHNNKDSAEQMKVNAGDKDDMRIKALENVKVSVLSKLYENYLPDFVLFGYDPKPLEDLIMKKGGDIKNKI